jgi:hypothetical protein
MATHPRLAGRTLLRRRSVFVLIFYAALLSHHPTTPPKPFPAESNAILATVTLLPGSFEKELAMRIMRVFAVGLVLGALILIGSIVYGSVVHQGPWANGAAYFNPGIGKAGITCTKTLARGGNVQTFVNNLKSGQVGCLHGGTYTSPNFVKLSGSGYTLAGYPGEKAVYRGGFNFGSSSNVTLQGFTVNASYAPVSTSNGRTNTAQAANLGSSSGAFLGSMVLMNRRDPDHSGTCVFGGTSKGAQIIASFIHTCGQARAGEGEHGIYIGNTTRGMLVKNTWVNDVEDNAWKFTQTISNNHFVGDVADKVDSSPCCNYDAVLFNDSPKGNLLENSVVRGVPNQATVRVAPGHSGSNNIVHNNCLWPVGADKNGSNVTMSNNVVADPKISGFKVTNPDCYAKLPHDSPFRP